MFTLVPAMTLSWIVRRARIYRLFAHDTSGAMAVEYGMLAAFVFIAILGGLNLFGSESQTMYNKISTALSQN